MIKSNISFSESIFYFIPKFSNIIVAQNIDLTKLLKDLLHQIIDLEQKPLQCWNIRQQKPFGLKLSP